MANESARDYTTRLNLVAAAWYQKHLGPNVSVVLVTDNKCVASQCAVNSVLPEGILTPLILTLPELLETYFSELTEAKLLLDSLQASLDSRQSINLSNGVARSSTKLANDISTGVPDGPAAPQPGNVYADHLSESALLAGLRSGQFLRGTLRVSRFRAATEAMVTLTDSSTVKHQPELQDAVTTRSEIAVHGMQYRNRAIDGDLVAIRLLPRGQWTAVSSNISAAENNAATVVDTVSGPVGVDSVTEPANPVADTTTIPCGFVVGVIGRNWRDYVCAYVPSESDEHIETGWILATPWDRRIPRIRMHTTQATKLSKERFVVRIDSWDPGSTYPHGHFVQSLGRVGDLETETQTLLIEHSLAIRVFSDAQLNELAPYSAMRPWKVDHEEVKRRRDLRSPTVSGNPNSEDVLIFSIDPPGCQDVDDALSVRWLEPIQAEDGSEHRRLQLGVHIADVTYFVPPGGFVDAEARRRSTSVYLADRRYDMLPGILSGDVCSLWSGVDRYAVSVIWEIDMDAFDVLNVWYGRTVIRSSYKLSYEVAQRIFDPPSSDFLKNHCNLSASELCLEKIGGVEELTKLVPELKSFDRPGLLRELGRLEDSIKTLVDVASAIRVRRVARGGLELDSIEITVRFADPDTRSGKLEDLVPKEPLEMHSTVAELMIFANHWVARRCLESFPERSCLRRHPPPRPEFFDELQRCAAARGLRVDIESNRALGQSLAAADDPKDPEVKKVLLQLTTRAMSNALYFSTGGDNLTREQFAHYGLALTLYTHFTSPIRRYADIIVHRILLTALGDCRSAISVRQVDNTALSPAGENNLFTPEELSTICRHMNEQHWAAQQVQRASMELFQALFFRDRAVDDPIRQADGIICQLRGNNGFVVLVSRYGIRGSVCVRDPQGQVAWMKPEAGDPYRIHWMPSGSGYEVERVYDSSKSDCGSLEVRSSHTSEVQRYTIFDHVTVAIGVAESAAHGLGLRLQLIRGPHVSTDLSMNKTIQDSTQARADLIESVQNQDSKRRQKRAFDEQQTASGDEMEVVDQEVLIARLHDPRSMYHQFRKLLRDSTQTAIAPGQN
ncbi:DIS3 exonuclease 1 [Fasciolopsis buskii]|uniref:DIS3-like exonuclease 1 n=1 Tax=Fasciolopsis buskii TaxID=27845 RepID=A0A8E0VFI4_9TREM|nr:DIS3 exonuclease 1 [Fasciolopsis buski]